jgi:hypothetical protein
MLIDEQDIWERAEYYLNPAVFNHNDQRPAKTMRRVDRRWFMDRPKAICRIRLMRRGESDLVDDALNADDDVVCYVIVLHHARLNDRRSAAGVGFYPLLLDRRDEVADLARAEAKAMIAWYSTTSENYPHEGVLDQRVQELLIELGLAALFEAWPSGGGSS